MEIFAKSSFLIAMLLGLLVPAVAWIERRQRLLTSLAPVPVSDSQEGVVRRALRDLDAAVRDLAHPGEHSPSTRRGLHRAAPAIAVLAPLTGFAWIPFAGEYTWNHRAFHGVVAPSSVSVLWIAGMLMLGCIMPAVAGFARQESRALQSGLRAAILAASFQLPLLLSVLGVALAFDTLSLSELASAQDRSIPLAGILEPSFGPTLPALADARFPGWGLFFQPIAFFVFFLSVLAAGPEAPLAAAASNSEDGLTRGEWARMRSGLYPLAAGVHVALVAAFATTLFLGGWAIPGLATAPIIGSVAVWFGDGFAVFLCVMLHVALFVAKLLFIVWLLLSARALLPRLRPAQWMRVCWLVLVPLAVINLFATGAAIAWWTNP